MVRLFTALELPGSICERLESLRSGIPGARWQTRDQFHLTLRFIGALDGAKVQDVLGALSRIDAPAFEVTLQGVGQFGDKSPHTLWAGVAPNERLMRLAAKVDQALQRAGLPPEGRRYTPHVTLARLNRAPHIRVAEFLGEFGLFRAGPFRADAFVLFSSHLGQGGAHYRAEAHIPLQADPGAGALPT